MSAQETPPMAATSTSPLLTDGERQRGPAPAEDGVTMARLTKELPDQVESWLAEFSLQALGELQVEDCPSLAPLKRGEWITMPADSVALAEDWEARWRGKLTEGQEGPPSGWRSTFQLMASMVTLKDACCAGDRGLLRPLLKQAWAGSCSESVFGSGAVRAVVNYKWSRYASAFIVGQLACYVVWLLSFTGFVMLMNYGSRPLGDGDRGWHGPAYPGAAYSLLGLSTALMAPFALLELRTIWVYRSFYARRTVVADLMDLIILANHAALLALVLNNALYEPSVGGTIDIDILIAVQVTLLWAKLPYFFRGFKLGRFAPIDTLEHVVWEARYMLVFILFMMFGFGVGYTTLFQRPGDETDADFSQLWHSVVTMFVLSQGLGVNMNEMYDSRHNVAAVVFFVAFEFLISIVMFNTLLSLMVGAFDKMKESSMSEIFMRRAELIDEVDCAMQGMGLGAYWSPPYLHVLSLVAKRPMEDHSMREKLDALELRMQQTEERIMRRLEDIARALHVGAQTTGSSPSAAPGGLSMMLDPATPSSEEYLRRSAQRPATTSSAGMMSRLAALARQSVLGYSSPPPE